MGTLLLLANLMLPHKPYTTHTLLKSTALLSTPQLTSQSTPQHTDTPQSIMLLHTTQLQSTTLRFMPQSITQLQLTTNQLLIMNQPMKDQLYMNMDTLSKM